MIEYILICWTLLIILPNAERFARSVFYRVSLFGKSRKNEKEKHIIQALSRLGSGVSFLPNDPSQLVNRLLLLLGSKKAGNNNCFNEASAI